ncbi:GNAT family N-acetyltransferase [Amycolatopsis suaedae]|uniref:GNAT family N-acetyltransferase n=1 Tax=Amycolatopsis suaedae TaxID=2510978 RepID=A0A4Q7J221_9PSEU|nr:GNAT family N-acetyltransferase [Amycolatopsis suaedae]RZQ60443.1 GNAT family N-acetyltransferase [Amycolatopsis suaedae]
MPIENITVRRALEPEAAEVSAAMAANFMDETVCTYVFTDETARREVYPQFLAGQISESLAGGEVLITEDLAAVSIWSYRKKDEEHEAPSLDTLPPDAPEYARRGITVLSMIEQRHPRHADHLYLVALGVHPDHRGRGLGGAVLRHRLAEADSRGEPVYLEASSTRNRPLYERHGFVQTGDPIQFPDGPEIYPMWRDPR